jgi:hypothetical protein
LIRTWSHVLINMRQLVTTLRQKAAGLSCKRGLISDNQLLQAGDTA